MIAYKDPRMKFGTVVAKNFATLAFTVFMDPNRWQSVL